MTEVIDRMARESDAEFARLTGIIFDLARAAKAVCDHWAEFGPEYGFDETMQGLYRALALSPAERDKP